ncbi:hypothetical protein FRC00_009441 [Tulasnella sp. 408]|nr:hypothetical protein FRC00_009441 [Tulasnella sp. 408]
MYQDGCRSDEFPIIVAVEDAGCFVDAEGQPVAMASSPDKAPDVKIKQDACVRLIAGGHRNDAIVTEWHSAHGEVKRCQSIERALSADHVKLAAWTARFSMIDGVWRRWPVVVYSKAVPAKRDAKSAVMRQVRIRLGANIKGHLFEGTPREMLQMALLDPKNAAPKLPDALNRVSNLVEPPPPLDENPFIKSTHYSIFDHNLHAAFDEAFTLEMVPCLKDQAVR